MFIGPVPEAYASRLPLKPFDVRYYGDVCEAFRGEMTAALLSHDAERRKPLG